MKNNDIEKIWQDIEAKKSSGEKAYQRMICVDMLYRVYIGSVGIPSLRYLSIEIPECWLIFRNCVSVGSDLPASQFETVLGETPIKSAHSTCVLPALIRHASSVTFVF